MNKNEEPLETDEEISPARRNQKKNIKTIKMKDHKNIVTPFLSKIDVPEWAVSEIFGEPDPDLSGEDREALNAFRSRWTVIDYGEEPHFCTPELFYGEREALSGTCLVCSCLPRFFADAKLYQGDLVQRMGKTHIVHIYNGLQIGGRVFKHGSPHSTLLEAIRIYNALTQGHRNAEGYLIFKRGELIFSTNRAFEPLIPQIREKFPHVFNL